MKEQPIPDPGTQDLLVRVIGIGMNPAETVVRQRSEKDGVFGWDAYGIVNNNGRKPPPAGNKSSTGFSGEPCSNWPDDTNPLPKINVDRKTCLRYLDDYCSRLIDTSICWAAADTDTQFGTFVSFVLKKQFPVF